MATISSSVATSSTGTTARTLNTATADANATKKAAAQALMTKLGSGSGVDLNSLATSLVNAERAAQTESINKNIAKNEARISGYSALSMTIDTVKGAFDALQKPSSVNLVSGASSNASVVALTTTSGAIPGTHDISVTTRAQGQRNLSTGFAATDTKVSNSDFYLQLTVNGKTKMVKVGAASATPTGMVNAINNAKLGINAQLINTGDGTANPYKIVLNGETGRNNAFSFITDDGSGNSEQQKLTFSPATVAGSFKIGDVSVTVAAGDNVATISAAAKTALEAADSKNGVIGRTYTVNNDGTLTIEYAKTDGDMDPVTVTDPLLTGVSANVSTTQAFSSGSPLSTGVPKQQTLSFTAPLVDGTITVGGVSVDVTTSDTGADIAARLAAAFADPANAASLGSKTVVDAGSGNLSINYALTDGDASLVFNDGGTGTVSSATTVQSYTAANALINFNFSNNLQSAGDASFTLNGVPMSRASNNITDAIPGVTLNLLSTTALSGPVTLNVDRDTNALKDKVKALVDAVNMTMSDLKILSGPKNTDDPTDIYSGSLQNDSTVQLVRTQIRNLLIGNSASPGNSVTAMRDIGVSVDKAGTITFDEAKFNTVASTNFDDIVTMLTANKESKSQYTTMPQGLAGDAVKRLTDLTKNTGYIKVQSDSAQKSMDRYKAQLETVEARLTRLQAAYTKTFANLDALVGSINSQKNSLKSTFDAMANANKN